VFSGAELGSVVVAGIKKAEKVSMLGATQSIKFNKRGQKLVIEPPALNPGNVPCDHAWVFKVEGAVPRNY
jgi:alpha-L-fucosidase